MNLDDYEKEIIEAYENGDLVKSDDIKKEIAIAKQADRKSVV